MSCDVCIVQQSKRRAICVVNPSACYRFGLFGDIKWRREGEIWRIGLVIRFLAVFIPSLGEHDTENRAPVIVGLWARNVRSSLAVIE